MRIRNTTLWLTGCALAFGVSVALAGYIGFSKSMRVMTAPAPAALVSSTIPLPPPVHDPHKPTVAVLLGNTFSEPTDVLGPYALVVSGIYRYTRNPMYLGFLLLLMAWAAALSNVLALVSLLAFVLYMNRFQIVPEERMLVSRFGQDYAEYRARVRRWL